MRNAIWNWSSKIYNESSIETAKQQMALKKSFYFLNFLFPCFCSTVSSRWESFFSSKDSSRWARSPVLKKIASIEDLLNRMKKIFVKFDDPIDESQIKDECSSAMKIVRLASESWTTMPKLWKNNCYQFTDGRDKRSSLKTSSLHGFQSITHILSLLAQHISVKNGTNTVDVKKYV